MEFEGYPEIKERKFTSLVYLSLALAGVNQQDVATNNAIFDIFRWDGISDVVLIKEMFIIYN